MLRDEGLDPDSILTPITTDESQAEQPSDEKPSEPEKEEHPMEKPDGITQIAKHLGTRVSTKLTKETILQLLELGDDIEIPVEMSLYEWSKIIDRIVKKKQG